MKTSIKIIKEIKGMSLCDMTKSLQEGFQSKSLIIQKYGKMVEKTELSIYCNKHVTWSSRLGKLFDSLKIYIYINQPYDIAIPILEK